jgi:hypothetical protein
MGSRKDELLETLDDAQRIAEELTSKGRKVVGLGQNFTDFAAGKPVYRPDKNDRRETDKCFCKGDSRGAGPLVVRTSTGEIRR